MLTEGEINVQYSSGAAKVKDIYLSFLRIRGTSKGVDHRGGMR
jgi:hypothetical protein